jgi:hypothetical protein
MPHAARIDRIRARYPLRYESTIYCENMPRSR